MNSPTSRSLALLRKDGYTAQVVEKWNPYARIRQDLFGFIDIVAMYYSVNEDGTPDSKVLGVQTTSTGNMNARIKKILAIPEAKIWLECGNKIIVHGWSKKGATGTRKIYQVKVKELFLTDFS